MKCKIFTLSSLLINKHTIHISTSAWALEILTLKNACMNQVKCKKFGNMLRITLALLCMTLKMYHSFVAIVVFYYIF